MIVRSTVIPDAKMLTEIIRDMASEIARVQDLEDQYLGKQSILKDPSAGADKPDNRLIANFPGYITNVHTGYFLGHPISYNSENEEFLKELQGVFEYNDEQEHNFELAKTASKTGAAYELLYIDEDSNIRFTECDPSNIILVTDLSVQENIIAAIRFWTYDRTTYCEVYDHHDLVKYKGDGSSFSVSESAKPHFFNDVPVVEYKNNKERQGDFEKCLSLIHAYDKSQSETANDFEYFSDAYLKITGAGATESEDIKNMKKERVIVLPENADAQWLVKTIQDTASENAKNRLEADIHKMSFTPDLSDEAFAANTSGEAMKYKLWGMEQMAVQKERGFKKGVQRRIELICGYWQLKGRTYDWREIKLSFVRNIPDIVSDVAEIINKLAGLVPHKMLLSQLPFIENAQAAYDELQEEKYGMLDIDNYEVDDAERSDR